MHRSAGCWLLVLALALPAAAAPRAARNPRPPVRAVLPEAVPNALMDGNLGGDYGRLARLLTAAPPNAVHRSGQSALFFAVISGRVDLVRLLLDRGANPNYLAPSGHSVFSQLNFYQSGTPAVLRLLLERGARPELRLPGDATPLMRVAGAGNVAAIRLLLAHKANPNARDTDGATPLYHAAQVDSPEAVSALLAAGAQINHQTKDGDTALSRAASCGNSGVFQLLLARGANPRLRDQAGHSLLYAAVTGGSPAILQATLKLGPSPRERYPDGETPLRAAVELGKLDIITALLKAGADPNAADAEGVTPLMVASEQGTPALVQLLLEAGADVNRKAKDGSMAITHAKEAGRLSPNAEVVELLKKAGAVVPDVDLATAVRNDDLEGVQGALARGEDPNQRVEEPLDLASGMLAMLRAVRPGADPKKVLAEASNPEQTRKVPLAALALEPLGEGTRVLAALLQAGADVNGADTSGVTLLMQAAQGGRIDAATMLLAKGARIETLNAEGESAFSLALQLGGIDMVRLLLAQGADPNFRAKEGLRALHLAIVPLGLREEVSAELITLLVEKGAEVNAAADDGLTPLMLAALMPPPDALLRTPDGKVDPAFQLRRSIRELQKEQRKAAAREGAPADGPRAADDEAPGGPLDKLSKAVLAPVWNKAELIRFLLAHGADPKRTAVKGLTVVRAVIEAWERYQQPEGPVLRLLVEAGADVNQFEPSQTSPLAMAAGRGLTAAMKALLDLKADPNLTLTDGWTALHVALFRKQWRAAELLIRQGADVNVRMKAGYTPLLQAAYHNNSPLAALLLARHADVHVVGPKGVTPLSLARKHHNPALEDMLKKAGAK